MERVCATETSNRYKSGPHPLPPAQKLVVNTQQHTIAFNSRSPLHFLLGSMKCVHPYSKRQPVMEASRRASDQQSEDSSSLADFLEEENIESLINFSSIPHCRLQPTLFGILPPHARLFADKITLNPWMGEP